MKVAVTRRLFESQVDRLRERFEVVAWNSDLPPAPAELLELLRDADGALTLLTDRFDGDVFDSLPTLKVVSNLAVGFDNIDIDAATDRGVAVCTTPDVLTDTTAEFAIALIFAAARQVVAGERAAHAGDWHTWYPMRFLGIDLRGAKLGIIGLGRIGLRTAEIADAVGMEVSYSDPDAEHERFQHKPLEDILRDSDIISIHTPLLPSTEGLIDRSRIDLMRDDAILVNTARGPVIDTKALVEALERGKFRAVALDVTDPEPLPADHPLFRFDNVIVTPHIASATDATRMEMARLAVDNLIAVLEGGDPPNCLNPEVLDRG